MTTCTEPGYTDSIRGILRNNPGEKPMTQRLVEAHAAEVARDEARFAEEFHSPNGGLMVERGQRGW